MGMKFGFLAKFDFLQNIASMLVSGINPAVIHNIEKYFALKKVHYLSAVEDIEGDYLEFGVFKGSSFCHSIRCAHSLKKIHPSVKSTRFYGFDSFEGFGDLLEDDVHSFYTNENFETNYEFVDNRVRKMSKSSEYILIKGFFNETLRLGAEYHGIKKTRIVFIDSDTYSSSIDALRFVLPTIQEGSYIILDDFFSYKGSKEKGVAKAFEEFVKEGNLLVRRVMDYGMGGCVFIVSRVGEIG
jgi:O-methyltransferase